MIDPVRGLVFWGFLPGPREWALLALVVVALYGRSETARRGFARAVRPWTTRPGRDDGRPVGGLPVGERWFWFVVAVASAAVASWVATWITIAARAPGP